MPKTAEQLEAEVATLQTQVDVLSSATFALVDAICVALDVTGTVPKEKVAQSISDLAKARRHPDDDTVERAALDLLEHSAERIRGYAISPTNDNQRPY
jgi:cell division protein ZapA (FtsZ GTPase activity inhibitor)